MPVPHFIVTGHARFILSMRELCASPTLDADVIELLHPDGDQMMVIPLMKQTNKIIALAQTVCEPAVLVKDPGSPREGSGQREEREGLHGDSVLCIVQIPHFAGSACLMQRWPTSRLDLRRYARLCVRSGETRPPPGGCWGCAREAAGGEGYRLRASCRVAALIAHAPLPDRRCALAWRLATLTCVTDTDTDSHCHVDSRLTPSQARNHCNELLYYVSSHTDIWC